MSRRTRQTAEINAGSMADIAFLLLIFFLVTTTMDIDTGLQVGLPPIPDPNEPPPTSTQNNRDVLEVLINANNQLLVEGELLEVEELTDMTITFLTNEGVNPKYSTKPEKAIVSLKNDRGTSYETYVNVYNELKRAYRKVRDEEAQKLYGKPYTKLNENQAKVVKQKYPQKISEAEPVNIGGNN